MPQQRAIGRNRSAVRRSGISCSGTAVFQSKKSDQVFPPDPVLL